MGILKKAVVTIGSLGVLGTAGYFGVPAYYEKQVDNLIKNDNLNVVEAQVKPLEENAPKVVYDFLTNTPMAEIKKNQGKNPAFTIAIPNTKVTLDVSVLPVDTNTTAGLNLFKSGTKTPTELAENGRILVVEARMDGFKPEPLHNPGSFRALVTDSVPLSKAEIEAALKIDDAAKDQKEETKDQKSDKKQDVKAQKTKAVKAEVKNKSRTIFPYFNGDHYSHTKGIDSMNDFALFSKKYTQCIRNTYKRLCDFSKDKAFYTVISNSWLSKIATPPKAYVERTPEDKLAKTRDYKERHPVFYVGMLNTRNETVFEKEARELAQSLRSGASAGYWADYLKGRKLQTPTASSDAAAPPTQTETVLSGTLFDTERKELERSLSYGKSAQEWADALRGEVAETKRPEYGPRLIQEKPKV